MFNIAIIMFMYLLQYTLTKKTWCSVCNIYIDICTNMYVYWKDGRKTYPMLDFMYVSVTT